MRKANPKIGIVIGILCLLLAVAGIAALSSDTPTQPAESVPPAVPKVTPEPIPTPIHRNPAYSDTVVIGGSAGRSAVELHLEHLKGHVNASGWDEFAISITNPNEMDIYKTIYLEGTRYNWDASNGWEPDSGFRAKTVATLKDINVHPGDSIQITVPVKLEASGERNFYIFKARSEDAQA